MCFDLLYLVPGTSYQIHCHMDTATWALSHGHCRMGTATWALPHGHCHMGTATWALIKWAFPESVPCAERSRYMNGVAVRDGELILWGMKAMP